MQSDNVEEPRFIEFGGLRGNIARFSMVILSIAKSEFLNKDFKCP